MRLLAAAVAVILAFIFGYAEGQGQGYVDGRFRACLDFAEGWVAEGLPVNDGSPTADEFYNLKYECYRTKERANP